MSEAFEITREFLFKTNIHEITSISIEQNFDIIENNIEGEFDITGDYRLHEISLNKEDFSFKIPFSHKINDNINLDTVDLEVTDFTYEFNNGDELKVHIEYNVTGEQNVQEFNDEKELNDFLDNNEAEIISFKDDKEEIREDAKEEKDEKIASEVKEELTNDEEERNIAIPIPVHNEIDKEENQNLIINSINKDDEFVKYHIHTVVMNDTIENICTKYNINVGTLKKYNTFDNLELNMKLLIPENEEN